MNRRASRNINVGQFIRGETRSVNRDGVDADGKFDSKVASRVRFYRACVIDTLDSYRRPADCVSVSIDDSSNEDAKRLALSDSAIGLEQTQPDRNGYSN